MGITCIEVVKDKKAAIIGTEKAFTWLGAYKNANLGTAYPLQWAWEKMCNDNKENLFVVIDSDMFLCKEVSFNEGLGTCDAVFIIQYRGPQDNRTKH